MSAGDDDGERVGRGRAPRGSRYATGHRRSAKKHRRRGPKPLPYETVFGQLITKPEADGAESEISLEQLVVQHLERLAMLGSGAAHEQLLRAEAELRKRVPSVGDDNKDYIYITGGLRMGSVNEVVLPLDIAVKKDPDSADPLILLKPWAIEEALALLDRQLTGEEQRVVWEATLTPRKVRWPEWWTERRGTRKPKRKRPLIEDGAYPPCIRDDDDETEEERPLGPAPGEQHAHEPQVQTCSSSCSS